ncbi:nucleotidyltransferase family protein [Mitsuaria sp. 7]|uniref:nucleotidyltransferase family protein n=1 Tax=Mitsuaria sp. 7 TaxID=1658665 RepID=UPI0007DDA32E|nr:nucleotidyltransferase family protein [Mitsuaria sp. 7]ANH67132.1 hypothetical protein ABE85_05305 [Mitsuaria sp. 7]
MQDTERLVRLVNGSPWMMSALRAVRSLQLTSWCIGAGAIRNLVWDALSGYREPSALSDVDVAFFAPQPDPTRASAQNFKDRTAAKRYSERWPRVVVES